MRGWRGVMNGNDGWKWCLVIRLVGFFIPGVDEWLSSLNMGMDTIRGGGVDYDQGKLKVRRVRSSKIYSGRLGGFV